MYAAHAGVSGHAHDDGNVFIITHDDVTSCRCWRPQALDKVLTWVVC